MPMAVLMAVLLALLAPAQAALAHPLDAFLQATYITVAPARVIVELDLTPGVLLAPKVLPQLDSDGDQKISDAEGRAYVNRVVQSIELNVDGRPASLAVTRIDMPPYLTVQAGYGTIRIFTEAALSAGASNTRSLYYKNNFAPPGALYQVNTFVEKGVPITLGRQNRDSIQQSMTVDYVISGAAPAATTNDTAAALMQDGNTAQAQQLLSYLYAPTHSPLLLMFALALAGVLGGLHALTPGHGKTLVAAYLIGSRGTVRHAVLLGSTVTFTHTFSVIVIGLLALFASQFIVPNVLVPALEIISGVLVVVMGVRLIWQRRSAAQAPAQHEHTHDHEHAFTHDHGDGHVHTHLPPAEGIRPGNLLAMGISGGLVPCPEALAIMVIAVGLNRILLGLGLIVFFSFGLAAVLILIGVLLVRSRALIERLGGMGGRWSRVLPLASAIIVTVLGIGITLRGVMAYFG